MSEIDPFVVGDVVSLKSCGTRMTVKKIEKEPNRVSHRDLIYCHWFNESKELREFGFFRSELEKKNLNPKIPFRVLD